VHEWVGVCTCVRACVYVRVCMLAQAAFWKEVATLVEGTEGNTMMVAPNFMLEDAEAFDEFVHRQLEAPLALFASEGKQLRVRPCLRLCLCLCLCLMCV